MELNKTIPAIGGGSVNGGGSAVGGGSAAAEGGVDKKAEAAGDAPETEIATPKEELADSVLTDAEKIQVAAGVKIMIVLEVADASANVSAEDKAQVKAALRGDTAAKGYTVGQYLDISLYKQISGDANKYFLTETSRELTITIRVPESLKAGSGKKARSYAVIRVHTGEDGEVRTDVLKDLDEDPDTITIATDRFSSYTIVYREKTGTKDDEPKTGDASPVELYATLAMIAGFSYLLAYFTDHRRGMTEEKKQELVSRLIGWAKKGGRARRLFTLGVIFLLLVYYHSIGKDLPESIDIDCSSVNDSLY